MKLDYARTSRILIALVFIIAGVQKLMTLQKTSEYIMSLHIPFAPIATLVAVAIEIFVGAAFAWGYKTKLAGYILIGFTILVTLAAHSDFSNAVNVIMTLKNISIVGGIMAALGCVCQDCTVHPKKQ